MKKKKVSEKENEWKGILQENIDKSWNEFIKDKQLQDKEEEYCNVGVNKDWDDKFFENLNSLSKEINYKPVKDKRIDFEFTPLTFWQLLPSIAVNLHCNEIEITWLCFGMYIKFKRYE